MLLAETFRDPEAFAGTMYRAAGWECLGRKKGFARASGRCTDPRGRPKEIFVAPPGPTPGRCSRARSRCRRSAAPPSGPGLAPRDPGTMRSLHAELAAVPDFRRAQGRKHAAACVLAARVLAELANMKGCLAAAQFARALSQEELAAVGAWRNPKTGLREPVSKSAIHRVVQPAGPEALEDAVGRRSRPRLPLARALAADGRRIRRGSRNGDGRHETAALVRPRDRRALRAPDFGDGGGGPAATHDLLERSGIGGRVITLDALNATRKTAKTVAGRCGAGYVFVVKGNAPETFGILDGIGRERDAAGSFAEDLDKARGRLEQRSISVLTPLDGAAGHPGVSRTARAALCREPLKKGPDDAGKDDTETVCPSPPSTRQPRVAGGAAEAESAATGRWRT